MKNQPKLPTRIAQSMHVGAYGAHCHGSNSCDSDGMTITKRSNHIPRLMKIERVNSHVVLRRSFWEKSSSGRTMLHVSMIQAAHHHWPNTRFMKYVLLDLAPAVPRDEELGEIRTADHERGEQTELRRGVEVVERDVVLEVEPATQRDDDREDHSDAGEDRAGNEVRREDRRVPARASRHREVERDDGVHREHERRRERGEEQIGAREVPPLAIGVPPAEATAREDALAHRIRLPVAQHRESGISPMYRKVRGDREVREDREHVPHERALELRPDEPPVRIRNQPEELPRPPEVQNREESGRHDGEHRHRFGAAVDRRAESGAEQIQNRRDQRSGVTDTDPEDEGDDVHAPHHRRVVAGDAEADVDLVGPGRRRR